MQQQESSIAPLIWECLMYHLTSETITFVGLVFRVVKPRVVSANNIIMLMILCGMVVVVAPLAHAAHSTTHHGFVSNYHSQPMPIWRCDCVRIYGSASAENTPVQLIEIYTR